MSVWNNRYLRFQCNPHTAGNLPEVVYIYCRPFLLKQAEQSAEDDLELKKNIILFLGQLFSWFFQILLPYSYMQRLYLNLFFQLHKLYIYTLYIEKYFIQFYVNFFRGSSYISWFTSPTPFPAYLHFVEQNINRQEIWRKINANQNYRNLPVAKDATYLF